MRTESRRKTLLSRAIGITSTSRCRGALGGRVVGAGEEFGLRVGLGAVAGVDVAPLVPAPARRTPALAVGRQPDVVREALHVAVVDLMADPGDSVRCIKLSIPYDYSSNIPRKLYFNIFCRSIRTAARRELL